MIGDQALAMSREGAGYIEEADHGAGVLVTARQTFDLADAWGGKHPMAPVVLGHEIRLFDHLTKPAEFLVTEASGNPHVTHITYQVIK